MLPQTKFIWNKFMSNNFCNHSLEVDESNVLELAKRLFLLVTHECNAFIDS